MWESAITGKKRINLLTSIITLIAYTAAGAPHAAPLNLSDSADKTHCAPSASPLTFNSTRWHTGSLLFQSSFDATTQRGKLYAYPIHADGSLGNKIWDAKLDGMHAEPRYVGAPAAHYPANLEIQPYTAFARTHAKRTPIIYINANGLLQGFNATAETDGGKKVLIYAPYPSTLISTQNGDAPAHHDPAHGSLTAGDAYTHEAWRTLLVGDLGQSDQGIFMLDVTNPSLFSGNPVNQIAHWKFTDASDQDLGDAIGPPTIIRLANGQWAIAIGNGSHNTRTDRHISHTGNAVIYLLDAEDGRLLHKFDTQTGMTDDPRGQNQPNGITTLSAVDVNADSVIDYIYAPDLFGHVWKLDVKSHDTSDWGFAYGSTASPKPLFKTHRSADKPQSITTAIEVSMHPSRVGQMIYFGSGQYPKSGDTHQTTDMQTFYALWDRNQTDWVNIERRHLLPQSILKAVKHPTGTKVRITSDHAIRWYQGEDTPSQTNTQGYLGWYMDLYDASQKERGNSRESILVDPIRHHGRIIFVTSSSGTGDCDTNSASWLMTLDANSGGRLHWPTFDLNGDGQLTTADNPLLPPDGNIVISGVESTIGSLSAPGILPKHRYAIGATQRISALTYLNGSSGTIQFIGTGQPTDHSGRRSWRQIF
jgi:type IV pilus assembly protein PilY1